MNLVELAAEELRAEGLSADDLSDDVEQLIRSAIEEVFVQPIVDAATDPENLQERPLGAEPLMRAIRGTTWATRTVEDHRSPMRHTQRLMLHIPGRGNCLFDSIVLGLQLHTLKQALPEMLRQPREVALPPRTVPHGPCVSMNPDAPWNGVMSLQLRLLAVRWLAQGLLDSTLKTNDSAISRAEVLQLNLPELPASASAAAPLPAPTAASDPDMELVRNLLMG